ncbi:conserved hypothetical protein [Vibrio owensii]|uniref:DUF6414 family protein n=1 Tax=Vibrio owensii TaxID=696485 RepID=UPI0010444E0E|nr:hypothetical protein [Vibrio owensii]TDE25972.1 hypothetical protein E1100_03345 [Vibrio owensii]CAH1580394.1 conserved hypothetical protein [Vibrio owensii]
MIKNFIYLDQEKMYSLSSQLFEGITEYVLNESNAENHESENQKGPIGSGKVLGDVIISSNKSTEKKFFHDYSFTLFEKHLLDQKKVLQVNADVDFEELRKCIGDYSFIKVTAKAMFNDVNKITELFSQFNTIGKAIAHATNIQKLQQLDKLRDELKSNTKNREQRAKVDAEYKKLSNLEKIAKEMGLSQDEMLLENLTVMTKYGFSDSFEISQKLHSGMFTSCLERCYLREREDLLVKKYSRKTEKEVVVFGIISQAFSPYEADIKPVDFANMKHAVLNMVEHLTNVENTLSGKLPNEIVIDPIAAYFEV